MSGGNEWRVWSRCLIYKLVVLLGFFLRVGGVGKASGCL